MAKQAKAGVHDRIFSVRFAENKADSQERLRGYLLDSGRRGFMCFHQYCFIFV
jgi:hypothetical protein